MDSGLHLSRIDPGGRSCESLLARQSLQSRGPVRAKTNRNHLSPHFQRKPARDEARLAPGRRPQCRRQAFRRPCSPAASAIPEDGCCPTDPALRPTRRRIKASRETLRARSRPVCSEGARIPRSPRFRKRHRPRRVRPALGPFRQTASNPCVRTRETQSSQISGRSREEWRTHFPSVRDFHRYAWTTLQTCLPPPAAARRNLLQFHSAGPPPDRARSRPRVSDRSTKRSSAAYRKRPFDELAPASTFRPPTAGKSPRQAAEVISAAACHATAQKGRAEELAAQKWESPTPQPQSMLRHTIS